MRAPLAAVLILSLSADHALAGAWTLSEGDGQAIITSSYRIAPISAVTSGQPTEDEAALQVFLEYGLYDEWTLGLKTLGSLSPSTGETEISAAGHVRYQVWQGADGDVASVQVGVGAPMERFLGPLRADDFAIEADIRALYGRGWQLDWANAYVSSELGYLLRAGGSEDELRADTTAGLEPWRGVLGLLTLSAAVPLGTTADASLQVTPSIAYTLWPYVGENDKKPLGPLYPYTIQLGAGIDVLDTDEGIRLSLSLWRPF
ncbi:MAG: hypothetical protein AAGB15_06360 [Pseudomonadota bacterium]